MTEKETYFKENYGKVKAKEIAERFDMTVRQVYEMANKLNLRSKLNPIFNITEKQEQILLGGKLGDGSFKKNGSNYYYRECHSVKEQDYLLWKFNELNDLTTQKIYNIPKRVSTQNDQKGFQTRNSSSINKYALMTTEECIEKIDELGLLVWMLDDGWVSKHSKAGNFLVSSGTLTDSQIEMLLSKLKNFDYTAYTIGANRDFCINSKDNLKLKNSFYKYFDENMDIVIKKVSYLK